ncbi:HAD family hydrolase [Pseudomonas moraviensis]|uniref:HAD family hydrolase n=1 Tax=Pseudomonas moraviensis TaxID=321662 RepID=UPI0021608787|nr:HAD family hydrolase [Pseudomonas moraviensis]UVL43867.1 HAD family hydrolase [Pseudomonas moraviensis]
MIAAVIFDVFGTLLEIRNRQNPYRQLLRIGAKQGRRASPNDLRLIMALNGGLRDAADAFGISLSSAELASLECMLELELASIRPFDDAMPAIELLQKQEIKVAACSNLAGPYCVKVRSLLPGLDGYALSAELGLLKPDPGMYRSTYSMLGILPGQEKPEQVAMIGDSRRCDALGPRALGIQGYHLDRTGGGRFRDVISFAKVMTGR